MLNVVISHPSSGRSWLRVVIGKLHAIKNGTSDRDVFQTPNYSFDHKLKGKEGTYLFLLRDPRDLLVSSYHQYRFRPSKNSRLGEINFSEFIRCKVGATMVLRRYNNWHVYWKSNPSAGVAYYEDLVDRPIESFSSILSWFGEKHTFDHLKEALAFGQFNNLRKLSKEQYFTSGFLNAKDPDDERTYKFRSGKVGGYKNYILDEDMEFIMDVMKDLKWRRYRGGW